MRPTASIMAACMAAAIGFSTSNAQSTPATDSLARAEASRHYQLMVDQEQAEAIAESDSIHHARFLEAMQAPEWNREERSLDEILANLGPLAPGLPYNPLAGPWIFSGYRSMAPYNFSAPGLKKEGEVWDFQEGTKGGALGAGLGAGLVAEHRAGQKGTLDVPDFAPDWLRNVLSAERIVGDFMYGVMIAQPSTIDYAFWELPERPRLPEEDMSFSGYLKRLHLPEIEVGAEVLPTFAFKRRHWLHKLTGGVQFSQAYISKNWYQGGTNYISLLFNALWDVQLNPVYHPDFLLQSTLGYKLGVNSTPPDSYHPYSLSEDLLQWNFKTGYKAVKNFYWSYTLLFKTQLFNNYDANSDQRTASFLSPGELNMGLGMTYSHTNRYKTLKLGLSLSPLSYNLKTCIDRRIDPTKFNIEAGKKAHGEIGTNAECNIEWAITPNISLKSRLFAFTDYSYFLSDLETTLNFGINRFLSTQIYAHLRFDSSSEILSDRWKHWMLKEILSFGLTYTFSSKPI